MRRLAGDILAAITHPARARFEKTGNHGKQRGLAGAVGADQRGDPRGRRRQRSAIHRQQSAEAARNALDGKQRLSQAASPAGERGGMKRRAGGRAYRQGRRRGRAAQSE